MKRDPTPSFSMLAWERGVAQGYFYAHLDAEDFRLGATPDTSLFATYYVDAGSPGDRLKELFEAFVAEQVKEEPEATQEVPDETVKDEGVGS